jgi:uracil-DNA glycosylase family 4
LVERGLILEYLRQRAELGERELYLDSLTRDQFIELLHNTKPVTSTSTVTDAPRLATSASVPEVGEESRSRLTVLQAEAVACRACSLGGTVTNSVFARGNASSPIVVVGEAPGEEEDRTGLPFVGRAGRLLDLLLQAIGYPKDSVYICNTLKCRPPGNRNPLPNEIAACNGFLRQQLDIVAPKVLLAVGKFAAQTLLQSEESIGRLRGQVHTYEGRPVVVTYHPAYLLRSPYAVRTAWHDFQLLRQVIDEQA